MPPKSEIKQFILGNYLFTNDESALADDDSLLKKGIVDSTGMLELIMHIEEKYGIKVAEDEMVPANLDSVVLITAFLERKLAKLFHRRVRDARSKSPVDGRAYS